MDFAHADGRAKRGGFHENGVAEFQFDGALNFFRIAFPVVTMDGDPRYDGDFRHLKQTFGDVLVHADRGAEDARADERQSRQIEQALNRSVFAKGAVHHGENDVDALAAAAAVQLYERRIGGVRGHHHSLAALQDVRQHFLRTGADQPVALFADADGHRFILVGIEAANHRGRRCEGDFMFAGASAEEDADAESFLVLRGHGSLGCQLSVFSYK